MRKSFIKYKYYLLSFFLIGIIVYAPMFTNGFVWDDIDLVVNNQQLQHLNFSIFYDNIYNTKYIYRQVIVIYYAVLYALFGLNALGYHLLQLLLHIIVTSLIFFLLQRYFHKQLAYLFALLFLVHPINAETVLWISSAQTILYTIFGLLALHLIQLKQLSKREMVLIGICLFLCLMTYEIGIFYIILCIIYLLLKRSIYTKEFIFISIGIVSIYGILRWINGSVDFHSYTQILYLQPTLAQKIYTIPSIILYYLNTFFFPLDLIIWQYWIIKDFSFTEVVAPALVIYGFVMLLIWFSSKLKKKDKNIFVFFTLWFAMGIGSLLQIVPLHMTVADRWFYFPFIGLLGMITFLVEYNQQKLKKYKRLLFIIFIIVLCLLSLRTFYRAFDWKDNLVLFTTDIKKQPNHVYLNSNLAFLYILGGKFAESIPPLEKMSQNDYQRTAAYYNLGISYEKIGNCQKSLDYFDKAQKRENLSKMTKTSVYPSLIRCYVEIKQYDKTLELLTTEVVFNSPFQDKLLLYRAQAYYGKGEYEKALNDLKILRDEEPNEEAEILYLKIQKEINK